MFSLVQKGLVPAGSGSDEDKETRVGRRCLITSVISEEYSFRVFRETRGQQKNSAVYV